jgi:hypothetical protein
MSALIRHRFKILLTALLLLNLAMPVVFEFLAQHVPTATRYVSIGGSVVFLFAGTLVASGARGARGIRIFVYGLIAPTIVVEALAIFLWPDHLLLVHFALRTVFVLFIIAAMLREIFQPATVTFDTVCLSLCIYLLLGVAWENVYAILDNLTPGAVLVVAPRAAVDAPPGLDPDIVHVFRMRYFSFATLTSVGYGDVVPGTTLARMCAITEAILGQIYLLVMVSRLVGMYIAQTPVPPNPS